MPADALTQAAQAAVEAARWETCEILSRKGPQEASDLLRGRAAELAQSFGARDQLLALALERAADDLAQGRPPCRWPAAALFDGEPAAEARERVAAQARAWEPPPDAELDRLAWELERRLRQEIGGGRPLAEALEGDAFLHERLWDDPRTSAPASARRAMLALAPRLRACAQALGADRPQDVRPWWRRLFARPSAGR